MRASARAVPEQRASQVATIESIDVFDEDGMGESRAGRVIDPGQSAREWLDVVVDAGDDVPNGIPFVYDSYGLVGTVAAAELYARIDASGPFEIDRTDAGGQKNLYPMWPTVTDYAVR